MAINQIYHNLFRSVSKGDSSPFQRDISVNSDRAAVVIATLIALVNTIILAASPDSWNGGPNAQSRQGGARQ